MAYLFTFICFECSHVYQGFLGKNNFGVHHLVPVRSLDEACKHISSLYNHVMTCFLKDGDDLKL